MKPLISEVQDSNTLLEIGRASVQIVHDLKNQLNGLKLYATFLRKRMEKSDGPADELETVNKLISGLERAASDMTLLVRYSRPIELRRQPGASLKEIVQAVDAQEETGGERSIHLEMSDEAFEGDYDIAALTESFKAITSQAVKLRPAQSKEPLEISLTKETEGDHAVATIKWRGLQLGEGFDPFHSFAGSDGLRVALAAKIIEAHGGGANADGNTLVIRLPIKQ